MISVIVPVYNCEKYIHRCVDSVLSQTYADFELILIDDGSKDNSGKICDDYSKKDSRIKVVHQKNQGVSAARNNGVEISKGEYITFIDSDDWIDKSFLQVLYDACIENDAEISVCGYVMADDIGTENDINNEVKVMESRDSISHYAELNLQRKSAHFRSPWAKLIKRESMKDVHFPTDRSYAEDGACVYLWLSKAHRVVDVSSELYFYFQNTEGVCQKPISKHIEGNFLTEMEWISYFKKNNYPDLYRGFCERYLTDCLWAINGVHPNDYEARRMFIKYLRYGLRKYAKSAGFSIKNNTYYYEIAYPVLIKLYYGIKSKLKKKE